MCFEDLYPAPFPPFFKTEKNNLGRINAFFHSILENPILRKAETPKKGNKWPSIPKSMAIKKSTL